MPDVLSLANAQPGTGRTAPPGGDEDMAVEDSFIRALVSDTATVPEADPADHTAPAEAATAHGPDAPFDAAACVSYKIHIVNI
jgi:hypothetical protein